MKNITRTALVLAAALSLQPAFAGQTARQATASADRYVARFTNRDLGPFAAPSDTAVALCSQDRSPADPIYFKLADGRCSGQ